MDLNRIEGLTTVVVSRSDRAAIENGETGKDPGINWCHMTEDGSLRAKACILFLK